MSDVENWAKTAGGNDDVPPDGFPENMQRTTYNNSAREVMAAVRRFYAEPTWINDFADYTVQYESTTEVRIVGVDATGVFFTSRRVKVSDVGTEVKEGHVSSVTLDGSDTVVTVSLDSGNVPAGTDKIEYCAVACKTAAFHDHGTGASEIPLGSDLTASITANVSAKSGALKDYADTFGESDKLPLYDQLGTAAELDTGTASGELPTVADLPTVLGDLAYEDENMARAQLTSTFTSSGYALQAVTGLDGIAIPGADGVKYFEVTLEVWFKDTGGNPDEISLRMGSVGDETDAKVVDIPYWGSLPNQPLAASATDLGFLTRYRIQPQDGDKLTVAADPSPINVFTAYAPSFVSVQEILGTT